MNVLVIGGGGREHAIAWRLRRCGSIQNVHCAPGNAGIAAEFPCHPLDLQDVDAAADLASRIEADLTIVGPELPLVYGIADEFVRRELALLGPQQKAAQLEGSKTFAKEFLQRHGIPTARSLGTFESASEAKAALAKAMFPLVLKADGLCAGKGVLVAKDENEAAAFVDRAIDQREFGDAGEQLLIEEALEGDELSYIILTDGTDFVRMAPARDHKRAFDGDQGPNTGGMGVFSSDDILPRSTEAQILDQVVLPTLRGLKREGMQYRGFLYFGLMLTTDGPKVLEYNCRLGDPETEAVLLRADFDFAEACLLAAEGKLGSFRAKWSQEPSLCVVIASEGYPGSPKTGVRIDGLEEASKVPGVVIFHASTKRNNDDWLTKGGRVLVVSGCGKDLESAREAVYSAVGRIHIEGAHYRRDVGAKVAKGAVAAE